MKSFALHPGFRLDINGLRAWAVVAVILYHFGVRGFNGGFVGVDVFFVISGFLMTGIVVRKLEHGDFSLSDFYLARAKRIVPALAVLCAVLLALGWFVLLSQDYKTLSSHAIYSLSFLSNVEYWQEAGYFDLASHEKWLLHTWSLSVEWQFYLLLPIVLLGAWRLKPGRAAQRWVVISCLAVSLSVSIFSTGTNPSAAFFLLHTRAWEMLGGGAVYLLADRASLSAAKRRWLEALGLLMIVVSIVIFDKTSAWPGWRAMVPVAASMMVLAANRQSFWTGNKVAQWIGDRSYSLYLWHWPVYVALVYVELRYSTIALVCGLIATLILGHMSYQLVENRARLCLKRLRFSRASGLLVVVVAAVAIPGTYVWGKKGVTGRFSTAIESVAAEAANGNPRRLACNGTSGVTSPSCVYGKGKGKVILMGDSHAGAIVTGLALAAVHRNAEVIQWSYNGCPFVPGLKRRPAFDVLTPNYHCTEFNEWAYSQLGNEPSTVPIVIIGRYAAAAFGKNEDHEEFAAPEVYFSREYPLTTAKFLEEFSRAITSSACELAKHRTVYMMRPIPEMGVDIPKTMSRRMTMHMNGEISLPMAAYRQRNEWVWAAQDAARDQCGIRILDPLPYLCHSGRCYGSNAGRPVYVDDDHLSEFGNKQLVPMFSKVFDDL